MLVRTRSSCSTEASARIFLKTSIGGPINTRGLQSVLWKRHERTGGGPSVGQHLVAHRTAHVITKEGPDGTQWKRQRTRKKHTRQSTRTRDGGCGEADAQTSSSSGSWSWSTWQRQVYDQLSKSLHFSFSLYSAGFQRSKHTLLSRRGG